ncbi:MAG: hypothetical protein QXS20_06075 [Candidatus Thorarchaeota archaeon]
MVLLDQLWRHRTSTPVYSSYGTRAVLIAAVILISDSKQGAQPVSMLSIWFIQDSPIRPDRIFLWV